MTVSRRGSGQHSEAEQRLESEEEEEEISEGGWAWERCELSQSPLSVPGFSVKDTVLKPWLACALCQGMPKTMTSSSSDSQGHKERAPDSHRDLYSSLTKSSVFALRLSLCICINHEVFILKNTPTVK